MLFLYVHFHMVSMRIVIHIAPVFSRVKYKIHYNVTHKDNCSLLHCGTVYTEITPQWAQRRVLISVSLLWVNMMM